MQYRLSLLLWVTTVTAVGLGAFGGWGLVAAGCTFYFWGFLFATRETAPKSQANADLVLYVLLMGLVFLSGAASIEALHGLSDPSGYPMTQLLLVAFFFALSLLPAMAYRRSGPS